MNDSVDEYLLVQWNERCEHKISDVSQTWELCRTLASEGHLLPNRENVSTLEIGPFLLALADERRIMAEHFVVHIIPSLMETFCQGMDFARAVTEILQNGAAAFLALSRSAAWVKEKDLWNLLIYIKHLNSKGIYPDVGDLLIEVRWSNGVLMTDESIRQMLDQLGHYKTFAGEVYLELVREHPNGSLECVV